MPGRSSKSLTNGGGFGAQSIGFSNSVQRREDGSEVVQGCDEVETVAAGVCRGEFAADVNGLLCDRESIHVPTQRREPDTQAVQGCG